jgi:hypothetical protein
MLIIASDIHLGDGTCGKSISPEAFTLFSERLQELAYHASFLRDGRYRPVEKIDLVFMGDILDPLHSSLWLGTAPGEVDYIRPWSDPSNPYYAAKLQQVTHAILKENRAAVETLKRIALEQIIQLPPAVNGLPDVHSRERVAPIVNTHYMAGKKL